ncbi:MAG: hypothetical protein VR72_09070 [Clostridiaceae bacterium BRH_c20a]|nr:MAG: hypothetical protein VR72_09070 [Clostridiaceae bacterium BRH_c20a]
MSDLLEKFIMENKNRMFEELSYFCSIPTTSSEGSIHFNKCENFLVQYLNKLGFEVKFLPTPGKKMIYAKLQGQQDRSLLFYNHYDVVNPGLISQWDTPPFEPTLIGDKLFGRGTSDHKGSLLARIHAVEGLLNVERRLQLTTKFLIEAEEEEGSPHLRQVVLDNRSLLQAEACFYPGWRRDEQDRPRVNAGSRGSFVVRVSCRTAAKNLHEAYAPLVPNPLTRIVQAISTLFTKGQDVAIRGFFDDIYIDNLMEKALENIPFDPSFYQQELGVSQLLGEMNREVAVRRNLIQPTILVFSLKASSEQKDILANEAEAWLRFQLVPDQNPDKIFWLFQKHLHDNGFSDLEAFIVGPIIKPSRTPIDSSIIKTVLKSGEKVYGCQPILVPVSSGSGPKDIFVQELGIPTVADVGVGYSKSNDHGPNEHIRLNDYWLNIQHIAEIIRTF